MKYGLWDSYRDLGNAIREKHTLENNNWKVRLTKKHTDSGLWYRLWVKPPKQEKVNPLGVLRCKKCGQMFTPRFPVCLCGYGEATITAENK